MEKGRLLQRNLNHDTHPIANLYAPGGADRLENWTDDLKETDIFSRRRPGRGVLQNPAASYTEEEAERLPPVGATFLVRVRAGIDRRQQLRVCYRVA